MTKPRALRRLAVVVSLLLGFVLGLGVMPAGPCAYASDAPVSVTKPKPKVYKLTYKANGGTGKMAKVKGKKGKKVTVKKSKFKRAGYKFVRWNTAKDGSGRRYAPGSKFKFTSCNVTLYAQWKKKPVYELKAKKKGRWITRKSGKKRVKVAYRFKDGTYPAPITKIGDNVYYFKNSKGKLGRCKKRYVVKVHGRRYGVEPSGMLVKGWQYYDRKTLYYFSGTYLRAACNKTVKSIKLMSTGKAKLTLDAALKISCMSTLDKVVSRTASKPSRLYAAWRYLTSGGHFHYASIYPNRSSGSWAKRYAYQMLGNRRGNCYGFACTFSALAYEVGYDPYVACGRVHGSRDGAADGFTRHGCVKINGRWYDPEAQFAGWWRGIYGRHHYPTALISVRSYRFASFRGTGKPAGM